MCKQSSTSSWLNAFVSNVHQNCTVVQEISASIRKRCDVFDWEWAAKSCQVSDLWVGIGIIEDLVCFDLCRLTLQPNINSRVHFTEKWVCWKSFRTFEKFGLKTRFSYLWQSHRKLVARRGFPIQLLLAGTLEFEPESHIIILQFDLGNNWDHSLRYFSR